MANQEDEHNHTSTNSNSFHSNIFPFVPYYVPNHGNQWGPEHFQWVSYYQNYNPIYGYVMNACLSQNLHQEYFHRIQPDRPLVQNAHDNNTPYSINGLRYWHKVEKPSKNAFTFSLVSYNILAQDLANQHPYLYNSHRKEYLQWEIRWQNLINELNFFNADVFCLQEVQNSHVTAYFSTLKNYGYEMLYKQRTGIRTDGCAIFYKKSNLTLLEFTTVEFRQPKVNLLDRDNIAIIAKFGAKNNETKEFVVSTTHLLYNPKREDIRLAQVQLLLTEIERIAYVQKGKYLPIIVTGDFNSTPDNVVYQFLTQGQLSYENLTQRSLESKGSKPKTGKMLLPPSLQITDNCQHAALLEKRQENVSISRSEEKKLIEIKNSEDTAIYHSPYKANSFDKLLFSTGTLSHNFALKSVYPHKKKNDNMATTFQDEWVAVDYILYSKSQLNSNKLSLLERYLLPTKGDLGNLKFPNQIFGSDHLAVAAKFSL